LPWIGSRRHLKGARHVAGEEDVDRPKKKVIQACRAPPPSDVRRGPGQQTVDRAISGRM